VLLLVPLLVPPAAAIWEMVWVFEKPERADDKERGRGTFVRHAAPDTHKSTSKKGVTVQVSLPARLLLFSSIVL
jgi:hypothetical protein